MNKFIIELFKQFNYEEVGGADDISFIKHKDYADFWIIANAVDAFKLEDQETIAEKAKTTIFEQHKEAEKNTSLLVLLEVNQISEDILNTIIEIENDPFYFKKYVLAYTPKSSKETIGKFSPENFSPMLMQPQNFKALKDEVEVSDPYHLLYSIAHKLPFLMTDVQVQDTSLLSNQYIPSEEMLDAFNWMQSIDFDTEDFATEVLNKFENLISTEDGTI